jgi:hypothetical protein
MTSQRTLGLPLEVLHLLSAGEHFAVDVEFTASAGDEVRVLGSKVEDEDAVERLCSTANAERRSLSARGDSSGRLGPLR